MTRALITGGAGYLAASLAHDLLAAGRSVRRMHRPGKAAPEAPAGAALEDFVGDVTRREDVERAVRDVDVVFHLASQTSVYVAEADPEADVTANVLPMLYLLEACRALGTRPLVIFAGTVTQAGIPKALPVDESALDDPCTIYDVHKLVAERYLKHYSRSGFVRGATLRLANVYGPGPKSSRADRGVLNAMIKKALAGETLKLYGTGEYLRDYVYVEDAARAFALAGSSPEAVDGKHFVLGTGEGHTLAHAVRLVAELVAERIGRSVPVEHVPPPASLSPIETRNFVANPGALRAATGWAPRVSLRAGISRTIDYFWGMEERT